MLDPRWACWEYDRAEATRWRVRGVVLCAVGAVVGLLAIPFEGTEATLLTVSSWGVQVFGSIPCTLTANKIIRPYARERVRV